MIKNKKFIFGLFLLAIAMLSGLAEASITFHNSLNRVYSVGDNLVINFSIDQQSGSPAYLEVYLKCGDRSFLVHKKYSKIGSAREYFFLDFPLSLSGDCNLVTLYAGEEQRSQDFKISNNISIDYRINSLKFFPGEEIVINGSATKENSRLLNGTVVILISGIENKTLDSLNGFFLSRIKIPEGIAPGNYTFRIEAYQKQGEEIINYGTILGKNISIKSKPSRIVIEASESVTPPFDFNSSVFLLDQADNVLDNESLLIKIVDTEGGVVLSRIVRSNTSVYYSFEDNASLGAWIVNAYYGNLSSFKPVYIEENKKIDFDISREDGRSAVIVRNLGNVYYQGILEIFIENESFNATEYLNLNLSRGEIYKHLLRYNGDYDLLIGGKNFTRVNLASSITGYSVKLKPEIRDTSYFIALILFVGILVYFLFSALRKRGVTETSGERRVCMAFFKFNQVPSNFEKLASEKGFSVKKIDTNTFFLVSYTGKGIESKTLGFARDLKNSVKLNGGKLSAALNSKGLGRKASSLRDFAVETKLILDYSDGDIVVGEEFFRALGIPYSRGSRTLKIGEKTVRVYSV